jgi:hypothetical protein
LGRFPAVRFNVATAPHARIAAAVLPLVALPLRRLLRLVAATISAAIRAATAALNFNPETVNPFT